MRHSRIVLALVILVACGHPAPGQAQDDGGKLPAPDVSPGKAAVSPGGDPAEPRLDPAAAAASDREARAILAKAAERQNAGSLVEPGRLESFHVVVNRAVFERESGPGKPARMVSTDPDGLVLDWRLGSIRTAVTVDGNTTTKAWHEPTKTAWISDGTRTSPLVGGDRKTDFEQLQFHRRVIDQLLQVALIGRLTNDKSRWQVLPPTSEHVVVLRRFQTPEAPDAVPLTLWIENPSEGVYGDVIRAAMPASSDVAPLVYELKSNAKFPVVRVMADGSLQPSRLRFPFSVEVMRRDAGGELKKVLDLKIGAVDVNSVQDLDFAPPKR